MSTVVDLSTLRPAIGADPTPVELLADAHAQARQILDAARAAADELLADATRDRDAALAAEAAADEQRAVHERQAIRAREVADAETEGVAQILAAARDQAAELLNQAAELATRQRTTAEETYARVLAEADDIRATAQRRADQLLREAGERVAAADSAVRAAEVEVELAARRARLDLAEEIDTARREAMADVEASRQAAVDARAGLQGELNTMGEAFDREQQESRDRHTAQLEALSRTAQEEAAAVREKADREAAALKAAAEKDITRRTAEIVRREREADLLVKKAEEQAQRATWWRGWTGKAWKAAPWVALGAGIGLAASGEYELARLVGINQAVAPLLPVSIDIYAITAFRTKRDVGPALAIMAASNLAYHLAERSGITATGADHRAILALTAFVVLVFVLIIWRVHALLDDHTPHRPAPVKPGVRPAPAPQGGRAQKGAQPPKNGRAQNENGRAQNGTGGRAQNPRTERTRERRERAQSSSKQALMQQQDDIVLALYRPGHRPQWTEIRDALTSAGLGETPRQTTQRIRDRVEDAHPHLKPTQETT